MKINDFTKEFDALEKELKVIKEKRPWETERRREEKVKEIFGELVRSRGASDILETILSGSQGGERHMIISSDGRSLVKLSSGVLLGGGRAYSYKFCRSLAETQAKLTHAMRFVSKEIIYLVQEQGQIFKMLIELPK